MNSFRNQIGINASILSFRRLSQGFCLVLVLLLSLTVRSHAQEVIGPEEQYLHIYAVIGDADALAKNGKDAEAKAKYQEAKTALETLKKGNPTWKPSLVGFRLKDLSEKISPPAEHPAETAATPAAAVSKPKEQAPAKPAKVIAQNMPPKVTLLEAGAEPKKQLRVHAKAGDTMAVAMTMKMTTDVGMGQPMKMPTITMPMNVTIKGVSPQGDISYEMVMDEATVTEEPGAQPGMAAIIKGSMAGMKGIVTSGTISDHGMAKSISIKMPPGANPQLRQSMDQMKESMNSFSTVLPDEAVGVGAKWEVKQTVKSQGLSIDQAVTYEVVSFDGDRINLKSTMTQSAANQKVANPAMPQIKVDMSKMEGSGSGATTLDSNRPFPVAATGDFHTEMKMGMNVGGKKQDMTMKMDINMKLEAK